MFRPGITAPPPPPGNKILSYHHFVMIQFNNLTFSYGKKSHRFLALDNINATLIEGIWLLLGANGAGKTTLLHTAAGLLIPQTGNATIDNANPAMRNPASLNKVFIVTDDISIPSPTINDFADIHAPFYPTFDREAFISNLSAFEMTGNEPLNSMSLGTRKKAILAYALALKTPALLLDEPANGLDISARKTLRRLMSHNFVPGQTIMVSTHAAADLEPLYDGVIVLSHGHCMLTITTDDLLSRLCFKAEKSPSPDAIYTEHDLGNYLTISPNTTGEPITGIDFALLYSALMSPSSQAILNILSNNKQ